MKRISRFLISSLLLLSVLFSLISCGGDTATGTQTQTAGPTNNSQTLDTKITTTEPEAPPQLPLNMNPLTGLACDESLVGKRPTVIVFNNLKVSTPQSGISGCDIIYEVLAEGGILRLAGVSLDYANLGNLGSMRSARPYLVELALAYDAIFLHAGGTERAYEAIENYQVDDVDGVKRGPFYANGSSVFWRDQDRLNQGVPLEHTMFTSGTNLVNAIQLKKYRTNLNDSEFTAFSFTPSRDPLGTGKSATYVNIPHSSYAVSEFRYHAEDGLYYHDQFSAAHIDGQNNAQIATENVFILFTEQSLYPNQTVTSYRKIDLVGQGKGYYMNGGEYKAILWKRDSATGTFSYWNEDGTELSVKCGKSYISIVDQATESKITIS